MNNKEHFVFNLNFTGANALAPAFIIGAYMNRKNNINNKNKKPTAFKKGGDL
jgi:hypothetical protein